MSITSSTQLRQSRLWNFIGAGRWEIHGKSMGIPHRYMGKPKKKMGKKNIGKYSIYLVGGWATYPSEKDEEKDEFVSWDDDIPNIWNNKKSSKPPTSYRWIYIYILCVCVVRENHRTQWWISHCHSWLPEGMSFFLHGMHRGIHDAMKARRVQISCFESWYRDVTRMNAWLLTIKNGSESTKNGESHRSGWCWLHWHQSCLLTQLIAYTPKQLGCGYMFLQCIYRSYKVINLHISPANNHACQALSWYMGCISDITGINWLKYIAIIIHRVYPSGFPMCTGTAWAGPPVF